MQVQGAPGNKGWLDFRRADRAHWGPTMQARLLSIKNAEKDLLPVLQYARILAIKDGGVLLDGIEIHMRAAKSKPEHTKQTWWCMVHQSEATEALERMNPRSSSGFHVNDDDEGSEPGFYWPPTLT